MPKIPPPTTTTQRCESNGHTVMLPVPGVIRDGAEPCQIRPINRFSRFPQGYSGLLGETVQYLGNYMALPRGPMLVISAWVVAAWLAERWDRFPHLAVTSPEKRCGKTLLLDLLFPIVPRGRYTTNISPAALYRVIESECPTLLMDESQSISRRGSEASEVVREILNAGIGRNAKVTRCGGERHDEIQEFSIYGPKVFAMIGQPDGVLADRCLPVQLKRKTKDDVVQRYRSRTVEPLGQKLGVRLEQWAKNNGSRIAKVYDHLEPFPIENDRMAELLLPLQAVLTVAGGGEPLEVLCEYATGLDDRDREQEMQTPGVRLLVACREILSKSKMAQQDGFMPTQILLSALMQRDWEPWRHWSQGREMTAHALGDLLRPFGIHAGRNRDQSARGFVVHDFQEAWQRYLPPIPLGKTAKAAKATMRRNAK